MGIINRDLATSEKRNLFIANAAATATGATGILCLVATPSLLDYVGVAALGTSGSPTVQISVNRFIAGTGSTVFVITGANQLVNFGTSGPYCLIGTSLVPGLSLSYSMGSSQLILQEGDILTWALAGTTSAVTGLAITAVLRPIQDIQQLFTVLA